MPDKDERASLRAKFPRGVSYLDGIDINDLLDQIDDLEAQLPEGMKHCTIRFKECKLGHGWLTATNWVQHGCPTCKYADLERRLAETGCDRLECRTPGPCEAEEKWEAAERRLAESKAEVARLDDAYVKTAHEVEQTLAQALGHYPWYKDDQKNFPGATEADGVCVGDHVPESLAVEAAHALAAERERGDRFERYFNREAGIVDTLCGMFPSPGAADDEPTTGVNLVQVIQETLTDWELRADVYDQIYRKERARREELEPQLAASQAENKRLREALEKAEGKVRELTGIRERTAKYVHHAEECGWYAEGASTQAALTSQPTCTCGLAAALAGEEKA